MTIITAYTRRDLVFWLTWLTVALTALCLPWHESYTTTESISKGSGCEYSKDSRRKRSAG